MKLRVVAVGKDRSGLYAPAVAEYAARISRYAKFEIVEVPEAKKHAGTAQAKDEEGAAILAKVGERERIVLLDERGETPDSLGFAKKLEKLMAAGQDVAFVIGGSDGHGAAVRARAKELLALSKLTLAHRLARLVLVEQIYRAMTILRGEPYHK